MIGQIGFLMIIGLAIGCLVSSIKEKGDERILCIVIGCVLIFFSIFISSVIYYRDTISYPEKYIMLQDTIRQTKELITNKELNLADIQMHKELASLIKERNEFLKEVRVNNRSPFALFKIKIDK